MEIKKTNSKKEKIKEETLRDESFKKIYGKFFILLIIFAICLEYYFFIFEVCYSFILYKNYSQYFILVILFHFLLIMMLWCLITTMTTHAGEIPLYWGFHIGDQESKRKRYCLICNAFKPERSHHCSICNICILNMDHHCPWVNNCIGFYNRKFFMQLLFYLLVLTFYIDIISLPLILKILNKLYAINFKYSVILSKLCSLIAYTVNFVISLLILFFFKFHVKLVIYNTTTIESLDPLVWHENKFRLSTYSNWIQVFGENKLLWFFPLHIESGRPIGDGLTWRTNIPSTVPDDYSTAYRQSELKSMKINNVPSINNSQISNNIKTFRDTRTDFSKVIVPLGKEDKSQSGSQVKLNFDSFKPNFDSVKKTTVENNFRNNYESNKQSDLFLNTGIGAYTSTKEGLIMFSPASNNQQFVQKSTEFNMERILNNNLAASVKKE